MKVGPWAEVRAWEESLARCQGLSGSSRLLVPGGRAVSHRRQFPAQESSGCLSQRFLNSSAWEQESEAEPAGFDLGVGDTGL